ncbi:hypothetical protein CLF_101525 [Clonorchis sinensis]|uniref:Saposin B-type domain-containing protein n=1 Tax=Clonorchis sinensis TaxID=79923 RepID=G7Y5Y6_CLOSI|nr:hypothetical protein CLF_101525 [Clonorchis sinensis]
MRRSLCAKNIINEEFSLDSSGSPVKPRVLRAAELRTKITVCRDTSSDVELRSYEDQHDSGLRMVYVYKDRAQRQPSRNTLVDFVDQYVFVVISTTVWSRDEVTWTIDVLCTACETILNLVKTDESARNELKKRVENTCNKFKLLSLMCPLISRKFISETMKMLQVNEPKDICKKQNKTYKHVTIYNKPSGVSLQAPMHKNCCTSAKLLVVCKFSSIFSNELYVTFRFSSISLPEFYKIQGIGFTGGNERTLKITEYPHTSLAIWPQLDKHLVSPLDGKNRKAKKWLSLDLRCSFQAAVFPKRKRPEYQKRTEPHMVSRFLLAAVTVFRELTALIGLAKPAGGCPPSKDCYVSNDLTDIIG